MNRLPPGLKLSIVAGTIAALLVLVVELVFRKSLGTAALFAMQLGACAFFGTALVASAFLRLASDQVLRALLLASSALASTYVFFGLLNVLKDAIAGSTEPFSALVALPIFALFSLPVALPIALFIGWYFHRRLSHLGHL